MLMSHMIFPCSKTRSIERIFGPPFEFTQLPTESWRFKRAALGYSFDELQLIVIFINSILQSDQPDQTQSIGNQ